MKKVLKWLIWIVGGLVALAVVLVATLPLWLGTVARPAVNALVPKWTKTEFGIGHLYLNPYTGRFELGQTVLGNPEGYSEPKALEIGDLVVDVAMGTLCDKYVRIEEITLDGLFVSYVDGGEHGADNFTQIQYNLAGGKEAYERKKAKADAARGLADAAAKAKAAEEEEAEKQKRAKMSPEELAAYELELEEERLAEEAAAKKFVIDRLSIGGVKVKYGYVTIPVPVTITLTDVGKKSEGVTMAELVDQVWQAILKSASATGEGAKALGGLISAGAGAVGDGAAKAAGAVSDGAAKAAGAVSDGASKAAGAVGDGTKAAVGAVSDGAAKAAGAVSDGASKAAGAVSDGASKAVDAVKGLFGK